MASFFDDGQSRRLVRCCAALLLVLALFVSGPGVAAAQKTVHVKEYTRKDGTKVKAHDRKAPEKKSTSSGAKTETSRKESSVKTASGVARDERGRIQRSAAARHAFARRTGYPNGRPGYVVDHIVPLACGGADEPSNMQWQTAAEAKAKDKVERVGCN
jgi:hypothetical protein